MWRIADPVSLFGVSAALRCSPVLLRLPRNSLSCVDRRGISTNMIRERFTDFFVKNGYKSVPSVSVVPKQDPNLLFTSAGMVPFKDSILKPDPNSSLPRKITSVQKCIRVGGKECDLENVGTSSRHLSFFEMLGFFQLPPTTENYKRDSIYLAMQFLTKELGFDHRRLKVTVHESDHESKEIWARDHGKKAYECSSEHNFWSMGNERGLPCGPCTEIYYDFSDHIPGIKQEDRAPTDDEHCLEIWNLVFMQFLHHGGHDDKKTWKPELWKPLTSGYCVDTGMGLERLASVVQGVHNSNFRIDSLHTMVTQTRTILSSILQKDIPYADFSELDHNIPLVREASISLRIIADHMRTVSIMIADGVTPSATGRGYVLRRVIRRMILQTHLLGIREPCLELLFPSVIQTLGGTYPELIERQVVICQLLRQEEKLFHRVIHQGLKVLDDYFETSEGLPTSRTVLPSHARPIVPPKLVFSLYDSMGFPMDLTSLYAKKVGYEIDFTAVHTLREEQRERSRRSWKSLCNFNFLQTDLLETLGNSDSVLFTGYQRTEDHAKLVGYAQDESGGDGKKILICMDPCPFYAEGGGQVGDKGYIEFISGQRIQIVNCVKMNKTNIAVADFSSTAWQQLEDYEKYSQPNFMKAVVDKKLRLQASQNHTATHLLNAALRKVLGEGSVHQAGSYVGSDRLRFDFTCAKVPTKEDLKEIEKVVRHYIRLNLAVETSIRTYDDAVESGALSLDSCEKYSESVRVVSVFDPEQEDRLFSRELCGGTHVRFTSSISPFVLLSESSVAAGVRRIEAVTGEAAEEYIDEQLSFAHSTASTLGSVVSTMEPTAKDLLMKKKVLEGQNTKLREELLMKSCSSPLFGRLPDDIQDTKIHIIKDSLLDEISEKDSMKAKKEKGKETKYLKGMLQKMQKKEPSYCHILFKGRMALCTDSTAKEKMEKIISFLGGSLRGSGKNFALGQLTEDINDSGMNRLTSWFSNKKE